VVKLKQSARKEPEDPSAAAGVGSLIDFLSVLAIRAASADREQSPDVADQNDTREGDEDA